MSFCKTLSMLWVLLVASGASAAVPAGFQFRFVEYPGSTITKLYAASSNDIGAGAYFDSSGVQHGFMVTRGKFKTVDDPNGVGTTFLTGVNASGTAVGYYIDGSGLYHGIAYSNGVFTEVGPAGSPDTIAYGINDAGTIVGTFEDTDNIEKGFIFDGTNYQTVYVLEASLPRCSGST
jgi:probable HAF family extracellular repeat protein